MQSDDSAARTEVKPSPIGGLGIFARVAIEAGEFIHRVEYEREVTDQSPLDATAGERFEHCAYPDGKVMLVAPPGRYMNHSCDPSAYYRFEGTQQQAYARRAIAKGEEITVDYLINNPGGDTWPCQCASPRCRGETGTSFFKLPFEFQQEYYPLLADWFKVSFPKEIAALEQRLGF